MEPKVVYMRLLELQDRILKGLKGPAYVSGDDIQTLSAAMAIIESVARNIDDGWV